MRLTAIGELRRHLDAARRRGERIGLVPTMGALHDGHLSLVRAACRRADVVVVSIFVNPTQFDDPDDLERYPRDLERDLRSLADLGACAPEIVFTPTADEIYPDTRRTTVHVEGLTEGLCGVSRPGHFDGVATVVAKLFGIVRPDVAVFGRKDRQQLEVVGRMVDDLELAVEVVGAPTVREPDGLAVSSRNLLLEPADRAVAPRIAHGLAAAVEEARRARVTGGWLDTDELAALVRRTAAHPRVTFDYVEVVDPTTFHPPEGTIAPDARTVVAVAAFLGGVRLIDNVELGDADDERGLLHALGREPGDRPADAPTGHTGSAGGRGRGRWEPPATDGADETAAAGRSVVARALAEDLYGAGDLTTVATVPAGAQGAADLVARVAGVLAGIDLVAEVYAQLDPRVEVEPRARDGDRIGAGDVVAVVRGPLRAVLTGERTALNLVTHLSGIATATRAYVDRVAGTGCVVRDTRKTTPGLRLLEKAAVRAGGGVNHRVGLFDGVLVKDNHAIAAGSVADATRAVADAPGGIEVQIEVDSIEELAEAVAAGATDVLLDNFSPEQVENALAWVREHPTPSGPVTLEVSGGVDLSTVRAYAETGVERVSVGAITHSAPQLDLALDVRVVDPVAARTRPGSGAPTDGRSRPC